MKISAESIRRLHALRGENPSKPDRDTVLVRIGGGDDGPPLFLVHPVGGGVGCYLPLIRALRPAFPVYGLRHPLTFADGRVDASSFSELAEIYLQAVRGIDPKGPCRLGGWSLGGVIAYMMARTAEKDGSRPSSVFMVDAPPPNEHGRFEYEAADFDTETESARRAIEEGLAEKASLERGNPIDGDMRGRVEEVYRRNTEALFSATVEPSVANIHYVAAADAVFVEDQKYAWKTYARDRFDTAVCDGTHFSLMTEPHVNALADMWRAALSERSATSNTP